MSADNWAFCPQCKLRDAVKAIGMMEDAAKSYGQVSPDEYLKLLKAAQEFAGESPIETLREDYGIGITEDGAFFVSYCGRCDQCGLKYEYKYEGRAI